MSRGRMSGQQWRDKMEYSGGFDRPSPPAEPLTNDESDELAKLREKDHLYSLGDRPSSMAAADIRRMIELESKPPAEPKCERCGATLGMYDSLDTVRDCPCPPTTEPAESEGKADLIAAVDNFIAVNAEMWQGQDPDEYMNEIRERPTAPPAESVEDAKAFTESYWDLNAGPFDSFSVEETHELMQAYAKQYATKQIERQTPAIIERFIAEVEDEYDNHESVFEAMQTVKGRIGGDAK